MRILFANATPIARPPCMGIRRCLRFIHLMHLNPIQPDKASFASGGGQRIWFADINGYLSILNLYSRQSAPHSIVKSAAQHNQWLCRISRLEQGLALTNITTTNNIMICRPERNDSRQAGLNPRQVMSLTDYCLTGWEPVNGGNYSHRRGGIFGSWPSYNSVDMKVFPTQTTPHEIEMRERRGWERDNVA